MFVLYETLQPVEEVFVSFSTTVPVNEVWSKFSICRLDLTELILFTISIFTILFGFNIQTHKCL